MITRELEFRDAPALLAWAQDPRGGRFFRGESSSLCLKDMEGFILGTMLCAGDLHRAIVNEADQLVGLLSLKNIDEEKRRAEFSIGLLPAAQGKGLAGAAVAELLPVAFDELGLESIYMYTDAGNLPTRAFNERCGFRLLESPPEGILPDLPEAGGELCWYGLCREEYLLCSAAGFDLPG
ncbi:MAG: GNAT family N-acetyltransferase [Bacillota bacterium]|nr:GNAT family N-acetyltransferase [Bacillota bacterium]